MSPEYFFDTNPLNLKDDDTGFLLLLDFDGTLVPIQADPGACILSPHIKGQLEAIVDSGLCAVAILSGRPLRDIRKRVELKGIYYGGIHGLEISGPHVRYTHPGADSAKDAICRIRRTLENEVVRVEGAWIEDKKLAFTLHYRMADKEKSDSIRRTFYRVLSEDPGREAVTVLRGKKALELMPKVLWDKGMAALFILRRMNGTCVPLYVGDDVTDETAFKTLKERGITVRVGPSKNTAARYYLKGQWEVSRLLGTIRDILRIPTGR